MENIRLSSKMTQISHSCGHPDLCLQWAGELSLSRHLVTAPEAGAIFIGASQALPLEVIMLSRCLEPTPMFRRGQGIQHSSLQGNLMPLLAEEIPTLTG